MKKTWKVVHCGNWFIWTSASHQGIYCYWKPQLLESLFSISQLYIRHLKGYIAESQQNPDLKWPLLLKQLQAVHKNVVILYLEVFILFLGCQTDMVVDKFSPRTAVSQFLGYTGYWQICPGSPSILCLLFHASVSIIEDCINYISKINPLLLLEGGNRNPDYSCITCDCIPDIRLATCRLKIKQVL